MVYLLLILSLVLCLILAFALLVVLGLTLFLIDGVVLSPVLSAAGLFVNKYDISITLETEK